MPSFTCTACGSVYARSFTYDSCPDCSGFGKINPDCLCSYQSNSVGIRVNVRLDTNPDCPVHGREV
jgi:hypothetical protein